MDQVQNLGQDSSLNPAFNTFSDNITPHNKSPRLPFIILGILLIVAAVGTFGYFLVKNKLTTEDPLIKPVSYNDSFADLADIPSEVISPITGEIFRGIEAKDWWIRRPLAVMINNYVDARPQSGLTAADIVYEIVAEGGITRFLAFYLSSTPEKIGPVRSTREYYLVLVKELGDAMIMHIGWSPQALVAIETWPVRSLERGGATFWRENPRNVATEHTAYVNGVELYEKGMELGWEGKRALEMWQFKDEPKYQTLPDAKNITIDFWYEGDYSAIWKYDEATNTYMRYTGYNEAGDPIAHKDQETGDQVRVSNLLVQFVDEAPIAGDDKNRLTYELLGSGEGYAFIDGKVQDVTWLKAERDVRTRFYDINGNELEFTRGKFWVSVVPSRNKDQVIFN